MNIAVDFDGVIHAYSNGWMGGKIYDHPVPLTREALSELRQLGHKIIIFTTRAIDRTVCGVFEKGQRDEVRQYLDVHKIHFDEIWTGPGKPMAHVYIDDRAIQFRGDWPDCVKQIKAFEVWNKPTNPRSSAA